MSDQPFVVQDGEVCRRALAALEFVEEWYEREQACTTDEELFDIGRDLYHVMRPVLAVLRRARGLPLEAPCTDCRVEEGGASSGPIDPTNPAAGRFSLCASCAEKRFGYPPVSYDEDDDEDPPNIRPFKARTMPTPDERTP